MSDAAHAVRILVWDVPSAVTGGETVRIRAAVGCDQACSARGWHLELFDEREACVATAVSSEEPWPDTQALHFAELVFAAPANEGLHEYTVRTRLQGDHRGDNQGNKRGDKQHDEKAAQHSEASASFNLRLMPPAECKIRIVAVDAASRAPVRGARVVAHPYRCRTDAQGIAELRVPRGAYRVFVSGGQHFPYRLDTRVREDLTIEAELIRDTEPSEAELWP